MTTTKQKMRYKSSTSAIFHNIFRLYFLIITFSQDDDRDPPIISRSVQPINYALLADKPNIGHGAPSLTDVASGKKRRLSYTKVITRKKKKFPGQSSAAATSQIDDLANLPSPPSEGNILNFSVILFYPDTEHIFDLLSRCSRGSNWTRRRRFSEHASSCIINCSGIDLFSRRLNPFMTLNLTSLLL